MKKLLILLAIVLVPTGAGATLWDYYGGNLPSIEERAQIAAEANIVAIPEFYEGTTEQNIELEKYLLGSGQMLGAAQRPSNYRVTLAESLSATASTTEDIKVSSLVTRDGHTLVDADVGSFIILTINPGRGNEEKVMCTNGTNTSTNEWQNCTRGYNYYNQSAGTATVYAHVPGETVIISDDDAYLTQGFVTYPYASSTFVNYTYGSSTYANLDYAQTFGGNKQFNASTTFASTTNFTGPTNVPYSTASSSAASVGLLNEQTASGCANADTGTKGCAEEATVGEIDAGTATGSTGAELFVNPALLARSIYASTTQSFSTTSAQNLATTTIPTALIPNAKDYLSVTIVASTTSSMSTNLRLIFNGDSTASYGIRTVEDGGSGSNTTAANAINFGSGNTNQITAVIHLEVLNVVGQYKYGWYKVNRQTPSTIATGAMTEGTFIWKNTARITQLDLDTASSTSVISKGSYFLINGR